MSTSKNSKKPAYVCILLRLTKSVAAVVTANAKAAGVSRNAYIAKRCDVPRSGGKAKAKARKAKPAPVAAPEATA